ncbi:MAG: GNAT family N-acetyltransferase [Acidobacteria bacterium]|nr:GNAT family N-acetyltransferase [Acidobacteriota bacterium]
MGVRVVEATTVTPALVEALGALLPHLSRSSPPPTEGEVREMVEAPGTVLFTAVDDDEHIVGTLTLVLFRIPTGVRAWIEDVIADPAASGQGIGKLLTDAALAEARRRGAKNVDLTSRPSREAANHIYKSMGFQARETNVYRYELGA